MRESRAVHHTFEIAERWQRRVSELREYSVVRDGNLFRAGMERSSIFQSEYAAAIEMRRKLVEMYEGKTLESLFCGRYEDTPYGESFHIEDHSPFARPAYSREKTMECLLSNLRLVRGIGPVTERRLKNRGFHTVQDLLHHPRYRKAAAKALEGMNPDAVNALEALARQRLPRSHPLVFQTSLLLEPERLVFLDIETLGLFTRPVILLGMGRIERSGIHTTQYLVRDLTDEPAALWSLRRRLEDGCIAFVTYNGRSFDIPYIAERFAYYGIPWSIVCPHYDLIHFSRRIWGGLFHNLRLTALERHVLGISREHDLPSQLVPEFYELYLRTGNCGPLIPIVNHNREDVLSLVRLYMRLAEECE